MADKIVIVEGRSFRTARDVKLAEADKALMEKLRAQMKTMDEAALRKLLADLDAGKYPFQTLLGQDFADEVEAELKRRTRGGSTKAAPEKEKKKTGKKAKAESPEVSKEVEANARKLLARKEKRRKQVILAAVLIAIGSVVYLGAYSYYEYRTSSTYRMLSNIREREQGQESAGSSGNARTAADDDDTVEIHYTSEGNAIEAKVLPEYEDLLNFNKKLIGWLKIDDTNIDYPVMQTDDNEYYLTHNLKQDYDKNGSIFMDKDCDVLKPSTNFILYGHHMRSGNMFGNLTKYEDESYFEKHRYITFDTIYEHGTYEVMYVFRSHVYGADEIAFKYYQFIDCNGELEYNSNMEEMSKMSLYDTGVTSTYGDRLLTLSTCDYEEAEGRFVVVAKKIGN